MWSQIARLVSDVPATPRAGLAGWLQGQRLRWLLGGVAMATLAVAIVSTDVRLHETRRREATTAAIADLAKDAESGVMPIALRLQHYEIMHALARIVANRITALRVNQDFLTAIDDLRTAFGRGHDSFLRIAIIGLNGHLLWSPDNAPASADLSDRDYFDAIVRHGADSYVSPAVIGRETGISSVHLAHAIRGEDGKLIALSSLSVLPDTLVNIGVSSRDATVYASFVLRGDGVVIASRNPIGAAIRPPADLLAAAMRTGTAQGRVAMADGRPALVALNRVGSSGLALMLALDEGTVDAAVAEDLWELDLRLFGGAVIVVLGIGLGSYVLTARRRTNDMRVERRAAARAAAGLRLITDHINEIVCAWECTPEGQAVARFVSPSCQSLIGVAPEDLVADLGRMPIHPDDAERAAERVMRLNAGEAVPDEEFRFIHADGRVLWFDATTAAIPPDPTRPEVRRFVSAYRDISARRQDVADLLEANIRIESLASNAPGALYELEIEYDPTAGTYRVEFAFATPNLTTLTGYTLGELNLPALFTRITGPGTQEQRSAAFRHALAEGNATLEYALRRKDNVEIRVRDKFTVAARMPGRARIVGFLTDMTEETVLRGQLVEAAKLAFLGEMASSIAHEMNQPLTAIALQANVLDVEVPEESPHRMVVVKRVGRITDLCDRTAAIIRRIRDFSRRNTDVPAPFNPAVAIEDAIGILESRLRTSPVIFIMDMPDHPLFVLGHAAPFEQVIMNLIVNAADAYETDTALPDAERIVALAVVSDDVRVVVTVSDRAGGLSEAVLPRVFEPFFTTKPTGKGTGLGLPICRRIIEDMGGTITARNEAAGALFEIDLPASVAG